MRRNLETKMDNMWHDGSKLSANISRIKRRELKNNNFSDNPMKQAVKLLPKGVNFSTNSTGIIPMASKVDGGEGASKTYADIIKGNTGRKPAEKIIVNQSLFFKSTEAEKLRFNKAK